jgi:hypothetical protein
LKGSLLAAGFSICYGGLLAKLVRTYLLSTKKTIVCFSNLFHFLVIGGFVLESSLVNV